MDAEVKLDNGIVKKRSHQITFEEYLKETLCCCSSKRKRYTEKGEPTETQDSLLSPQEVKAREAEVSDKEKLNEPDDVPPLSPSEAGAIYRERPSPSAPVIDDVGNVHVIIPMNRAYSFPVQASSWWPSFLVFIPRAIYGIKCLTCNVHCIPRWKEFTSVHGKEMILWDLYGCLSFIVNESSPVCFVKTWRNFHFNKMSQICDQSDFTAAFKTCEMYFGI